LSDKDTLVFRRVEIAKFGKGTQQLNIKDIVIQTKIGEGTFAKVYKGTCFGIEVAIKKIKTLPEKDLADFNNEIRILSQVSCPQVVKLYGYINDNPTQVYLVMELCSRGSLYHVMNSVVYDFGWDRVFRFATEFLKGMEYLHSQNPPLLHRDFKSLNLLLTEDWQVKICDFGLTRPALTDLTLGRLRTTPAYSPPELMQMKDIKFSTRSDVYGIAITMWEMVYRCLVGKYQRPFAEYSYILFDYQLIMQASLGLRPSFPPNTPQNLELFIQKCWDGEMNNRPTCSEMLSELAVIQQDYTNKTQVWDSAKKRGSLVEDSNNKKH